MGPGSHVGFPISAKNKNLVYDHPMNISAKFGSNQHQKHKSGRGPSSEHFWQVWLISVQRFQRRRFKCEKLTDGRTNGRRTLTHDKSSHGLWPGELKIYNPETLATVCTQDKNKNLVYDHPMNISAKFGSNQHQKHKSGRGPSMAGLVEICSAVSEKKS